MAEPVKVAFIPGAGGSPLFWRPVADRLPATWEKTMLGWPGAGDQPHDPNISSYEDLVEHLEPLLTTGTHLVAQSMGGAVAMGFALRYPHKVRRLVLVATSGGLDVRALGGRDWRSDYVAEFPNAASWVMDETIDYAADLARITAPTLLIWGDRDPISPVAIGEQLEAQLPSSELMVLPGGSHDVALERPGEVADAIVRHLTPGPADRRSRRAAMQPRVGVTRLSGRDGHDDSCERVACG